MAAFDTALARVQRDGWQLLPARINALARAQDHTFRQTILTPGTTLALFAQQIAHGNVACSAVRHLAGEEFSDSAWCQARARLPLELIERVQRMLVDDARRELDRYDDVGDQPYRWRGHRIHVVDGTGDSMPDTPQLREHYGVPAPCRAGLGFPTSHLLLLMDQRSGLFIGCLDSPMNTHDASVAPRAHAHLQEGDVLLGDGAFSGWAHLALISGANLHVIVPPHHLRIVDFTPGRAHAHPHKGKSSKRAGKPRSRVLEVLGKDDQLVECFKPVNKPACISAEDWQALPDAIAVREIRRTVKRDGFRPMVVTVVTTLLDPAAYPADELIELRLTRWMIETNIRHLKITLKMDQLKCKSLDGVRKERAVFLLVYNLIRMIMLRCARRQKVNINRLSFADTLAWLRWGDVSSGIELMMNPLRPGRLEPRVRKRGAKQFPFMTIPRATLKSQLRAKHRDTT
jgi:hypothetical protein